MIIDHIPENWTTEKRGRSYAIFDEGGQARCGVKTSSGKPCRRYPVNGQLRCAIVTHQGIPIKGELHPAYKHGKYSNYANPAIQERIQAFASGEMTELVENNALIDVRLSELVAKLGDGDFSASAKDLLKAFNRLESAYRNNADKLEIKTQMRSLGDMIESVADDYQTWEEILKWNRERRDMAKTIHQMTVQSEGMMPAAQVLEVFMMMARMFFEINRLEDEKERENQWRKRADTILSMPGGNHGN